MSRIVQISHLYPVLTLFLTIVLNCLVVQRDGGGSRISQRGDYCLSLTLEPGTVTQPVVFTTALQAVKMRVLVFYRRLVLRLPASSARHSVTICDHWRVSAPLERTVGV